MSSPPSTTTTAAGTTVTNPNSSQIQSSITSSDDNFRLDSPYLHRLIHHLRRTSTSSSPSSRHSSPTSKSAIESLPTIIITPSFLETDPVVLCPVCKDQLVENDVMKELPCKHMYHPDCILPWLSLRNTCPVCRFQMPRKQLSGCVNLRRRSRSRVLGFGDLMDDDVDVVDDEAMLGIGFSNLYQQHLQNHTNAVFPFGRINDSEMENGVVNETWSGFNFSRIRGSNGSIDASDDGGDDDVEMP